MSKRINISVADEFHAWLSEKAADTGLSVSSYVVMMLTQAKKNIENQADISAMMQTLSKLPPELIQKEMEKMADEKK